MELEEIRNSPGRFSHSHSDQSLAGEREEAQLLEAQHDHDYCMSPSVVEFVEVHQDDYSSLTSPVLVQPIEIHEDHYPTMSSPIVVQPMAVHQRHYSMNFPAGNMMEYHPHHHHQRHHSTATSTQTLVHEASIYRRPSSGSRSGHHRLASSEANPWAPSRSVSSLSDASCGSDSETTKSSAKSSPNGSDCSMNNYDSSQAACGVVGGEKMEAGGTRREKERGHVSSSSPSARELREVFSWVDENQDGLICAEDLRQFMTRVLAFDISADEAETLLLFYSNGRTLRTGAGSVVDFGGFLALYQCLCGEQASPEEQSMMATASRVFDKTRLQSDRWA